MVKARGNGVQTTRVPATFVKRSACIDGPKPAAMPDKHPLSSCRISVFWEGDGKFYRGTITGGSISSSHQLFFMRYDDGESAEEDLHSSRFTWHGPRSSRAYSACMRKVMLKLRPANMADPATTPESEFANGVIPTPASGVPVGANAVGWRLKVWWGGTLEWVLGEVLAHRSRDSAYLVVFQDGEHEWMHLRGEKVWWLGNTRLRASCLSHIDFGVDGSAPKARDALKWRIAVYSKQLLAFRDADVIAFDRATGKHRVSYLDPARPGRGGGEAPPATEWVSLTASKVIWRFLRPLLAAEPSSTGQVGAVAAEAGSDVGGVSVAGQEKTSERDVSSSPAGPGAATATGPGGAGAGGPKKRGRPGRKPRNSVTAEAGVGRDRAAGEQGSQVAASVAAPPPPRKSTSSKGGTTGAGGKKPGRKPAAAAPDPAAAAATATKAAAAAPDSAAAAGPCGSGSERATGTCGRVGRAPEACDSARLQGDSSSCAVHKCDAAEGLVRVGSTVQAPETPSSRPGAEAVDFCSPRMQASPAAGASVAGVQPPPQQQQQQQPSPMSATGRPQKRKGVSAGPVQGPPKLARQKSGRGVSFSCDNGVQARPAAGEGARGGSAQGEEAFYARVHLEAPGRRPEAAQEFGSVGRLLEATRARMDVVQALLQAAQAGQRRGGTASRIAAAMTAEKARGGQRTQPSLLVARSARTPAAAVTPASARAPSGMLAQAGGSLGGGGPANPLASRGDKSVQPAAAGPPMVAVAVTPPEAVQQQPPLGDVPKAAPPARPPASAGAVAQNGKPVNGVRSAAAAGRGNKNSSGSQRGSSEAGSLQCLPLTPVAGAINGRMTNGQDWSAGAFRATGKCVGADHMPKDPRIRSHAGPLMPHA